MRQQNDREIAAQETTERQFRKRKLLSEHCRYFSHVIIHNAQ